jgi:hypothetical protein
VLPLSHFSGRHAVLPDRQPYALAFAYLLTAAQSPFDFLLAFRTQNLTRPAGSKAGSFDLGSVRMALPPLYDSTPHMDLLRAL